jgi:hypothetical protein
LIFSGCDVFSYNGHESTTEEVTQDRKPIQSGPLLFPETFVDIGEEHGSISYSFSFKNIGNQSADNFRLSASCGCTTVKLDLEQCLPGAEGKIDLYIDQSSRGQGVHLYSVLVEFKADTKPFQVILFLQSHNTAEVLWNPKELYIETYSDDLVTRNIKLVNSRKKNLDVKNISVASPWITCQQVTETLDNTETDVMLFETNIDMSKVSDGIQKSMIELLTDDEEFSPITFPVTIKKCRKFLEYQIKLF